MRRMICEDCGKRYDFDVDDFCPRCGSFNQPRNKWRVDSVGNVVRVDGINESNHAGSFVHREVHREKTVRRLKGLDRNKRPAADGTASRRGGRPVRIAPSIGGAAERAERKKPSWGAVAGAILALLALLLDALAG